MQTRLKAIRTANNMTQEALAEIVGISTTTVNKLETGQSKTITVNTALKIANALHTTVADIFL